ncbi:MAG: hypothetical protein J6P87_01705 [Lachnospiraceae bacterium]|nr:hypothetical protein [Lachnospiraceae bacterium]
MKKGRPALIVILSAVALASAAALIIYFAFILGLRTAYKEDALEINDALRGADRIILSSGDTGFEVSLKEAEYYNRFLLDRYTAVYSRKEVKEDDESIVLEFGGCRLSFTNAGKDGTAVALRWHTPGAPSAEDRTYLVRTQTTFMQLKAYFKNMLARRQ